MKKNSNAYSDSSVIIIAGPTAVGKTALTIELAKALDTEIISADSMQIYKGFTIGAATPTKEEMDGVTHHLMSFVDPKDAYSVSHYAADARRVINDLLSRGKIPIVTGGTGLYINSLIYDMDFNDVKSDPDIRARVQSMLTAHGPTYVYDELMQLDKEAAMRIHPNNTRKVTRALEVALMGGQSKDFKTDLSLETAYSPKLFVLNRDRQVLYDRIERRVDIMLNDGLIDEVKRLKEMGLTASDTSMKGIGYKETLSYLNGDLTRDALAELIKKNTRHYAKRQLTWFRRYKNAHWIEINTNNFTPNVIEYILERS